VWHDDAAQVGDNSDDMAITAFPALAPHLRSVTYPIDFKPNIQKYDGRSNLSDSEIWTAHRGVNPSGLFVRQGGV
jgi:hypothetical protein